MDRAIAKVVSIRSIDEPEPRIKLTPQQAIAEVEELRRMFKELYGDPDLPMARVVTRRSLD